MYKIELADGTILDNLRMNGNTFISDGEVTSDTLNEDALEEVTITETPEQGEPIVTVLNHAKYDTIMHEEDGYHFVLWGESPNEKMYRELREDMEEGLASLLEFVLGEE